ncbi:MAG: excinuclease ABC subunit UvrA, partial [Prevotellaceae bacterium]|nr:excinuclease ABC subunit UvrA [Prevotellaceae bacterium]
MKAITVHGAREHNLKNIDVTIPRNKLTVITGLSGSGKSSLAFNTIYAEGQRRYLETLPSYARQFLSNMERPNVDHIAGLSPVIAIEQKTINKNPRSTVGTITEIYDFMRLLYARASIAYSKNTGEQMVRYTDEQIVQLIIQQFLHQKCLLLAPLIKGRKGHYKELFEQLRKHGFLSVRIDGVITEIRPQHKLDRYKVHFIEVVIDKLTPNKAYEQRLRNSVATAMQQGSGEIAVLDIEKKQMHYYSRSYMCPSTGISYAEPAPHSFSFNSPQGACPYCNGLGTIAETDIKKIIPNPAVSIKKGGIKILGKQRNNQLFAVLEAIARKYTFTMDTPIADIPKTAMNIILYGSDELFQVIGKETANADEKKPWDFATNFPGIMSLLEKTDDDESDYTGAIRPNRFLKYIPCPECHGTRLKEETLFFKIAGKNITELSNMDILSLSNWFEEINPKLSSRQQSIAKDILKEICDRLTFMKDVGLGYLSLNRSARSLSGGESQRIRLASQIGSKLVNVLYIMDEPSIGLHQYDNQKLITALKRLRDEGNSVIVVEHDEEIIRQSDFLIDLGPAAGEKGGKVIYAAPPPLRQEDTGDDSLTLQYLSGKKQIPLPAHRRKGNGKKITLSGASGNNLKNLTVDFPLGIFICVTGMSGSGKSSLINETLHPILSKKLYRTNADPLPYEAIDGIQHIDKVIEVNQMPIGRLPRSNTATYTSLFLDIRKLFVETPDAKIRGYKAGRFSFNIRGGRCEDCHGAGVQTIEMSFMPDIYVTCKTCNGKRYNRETLEVRYKGKNISDVLNMTINVAHDFFMHIPSMKKKLQALQEVGLGYVKLGQPSPTLSGGESQRVKLAAELAKPCTGNTLYILDEPTTGLHFEDVHILLGVLNRLVENGNTVIVIEHHLDVIKTADYIIDLGPEGGEKGGYILASGTPEEIAQCNRSYTGQALKQHLKLRV